MAPDPTPKRLRATHSHATSYIFHLRSEVPPPLEKCLPCPCASLKIYPCFIHERHDNGKEDHTRQKSQVTKLKNHQVANKLCKLCKLTSPVEQRYNIRQNTLTVRIHDCLYNIENK